MSKWERFLNLGYDEKTIKKVRFDMDKDNIIMVKNVSILLVILLTVLLLFYILVDYDPIRNLICIISAILLTGLVIASNTILKDHSKITPQKTDLLVNALSFLCLSVGIYLGTLATPDDMAVASIWMFFFIVLIFNRLPAQNMMVLGISGSIFIVCSFTLKSLYHFEYDVMHAITSIFPSFYMSWYKSKQKLENVLALQKLKESNLAILEVVEEQEKQTELLRYRAEYDELSGFYKKISFEKIVKGILDCTKKDQIHILICSDIDNFKNINDSFGHLYGDEVLKEIVTNIVDEMGENHIFGRFGGDEFMVFLENVTDINQLLLHIHSLENRRKKTYQKQEIEQHISLSIGYAFFPQDGHTYKTLFEKADIRIYEEKKRKKAIR